MLHKLRNAALAALVILGVSFWGQGDALAYINQIDGTVLPVSSRLQQCLDLPATAETTVGAVDAIADAAVLPEAYRPVFDTPSGHYRVTFVDIGEGAGFYNSFGWYWVGDDVTNPANLHTVFGCRTYGTCNCPCTTTRTRSIDFDLQGGFMPGRPIGFWLRTPERLDGTRENGGLPSGCTLPLGCDPTGSNVNDSCGGRLDTNNRIYFTSQALNDDGDFVHFLVYRSATRTNTFYFGFEDLFRGGDNDFEDMLVRATGLVPLCDPGPETCNNADDDCDGAVDEGISVACSNACGAGVRVCSAGVLLACDAPTSRPETCDNTDQDCDGSVDEGVTRACSNSCGTGTEICRAGMFADCSARTPTIETCNDTDDDCDGSTDESLTRSCLSTCGSGIETCMGGVYGGCTAPTPGVETCNNVDQDCDGRTDEGLTRPCSSACGSGTETCVAGSYIGCTAPVGSLESCDGLDNDCDGLFDEGITRACSTSCGVGTEVCMMGMFTGCDAPLPAPETCNNVDDDCNGVIDDGNPGGGAACIPDGMGGFETTDGGVPDGGGDFCLAGRVACLAGELVCRGASGTSREVCNCLDDDCDGTVDEDPDGTLCGAGVCLECECRTPCLDSEFPCPSGQVCDRTLGDPGYCVGGPCASVTCDDGLVCNPSTGECEDRCAGRTCDPGFVCQRGSCLEDSCYALGCPSGERCRDGACEADPCEGVTCGGDTFCRDGTCVAACTDACPSGQSCVDGACAPHPCGTECALGRSCIDGACVLDTCEPACRAGRVCRGDTCVDDPCVGVRCPDGTVCTGDAQCVLPESVPRPPADRVLATGGCSCETAPGAPSRLPPWAWAALLGFAVVARRRIRLRRIAWRRVALALGLAGALSGCDVDPFCLSGCGDDDAGRRDAAAGTDAHVEGCVSRGEEECNEIDDDCDGVTDEGFDLTNDPRHCGSCDNECMLPNAFPGCEASQCVIDECALGHHDLNGAPGDGCEYTCPPSGVELCDERDNDCDGDIDEDFDLTSDLEHCGACGNTCAFANAGASCVASACVMGACNTGFVDLDMMPDTGCEYRCTPAGAETCNRVDDDCDSRIDETFDLTTDPMNCGECGRRCTFLNAVGVCAPDAGGAPVCGIAMCLPGFYDIDLNPVTGCEYPCTPTGADTCDGTDNDCDGAVDEADTRVGMPCNSSVGACRPGVNSCQLGGIVCVGGVGPQMETCNGVDDDCDGSRDELPLPGIGDRCGSTNVGRCEFGTTVCSAGGTITCGGAFVGPTGETCNGVDDDCDGATDDSLTPPASSTIPSCAETRGVCVGRVPTCRGAAGWGCDLPSSYQATESICDGFDNDCDGTPDEGCLRPTGASDLRVDLGDTASSQNSVYPNILGDGGNNVWVAWTDLRNGASSHAFFGRSSNAGLTWANAVQLDSAGGKTFTPRLGYGGADDVVAVWPDFRGGTTYREIYSRFSNNAGASFAGNVKVNASGASQTVDSFDVDVASSGTNVYAVWAAFLTSRTRHVFFARSTTAGASFGAPVQLSTPAGATFVAANPQVAAAGTGVYVVWRDNRNGAPDLYMRRSTNSGSSFVASEQRIDLGDGLGAASSFSPTIAARGTDVVVTWVDDRAGGSFDVWTNRSHDSGATWAGTALQLDMDPFAHDSIEPIVAMPQSGVAMVAWVDYRFGFPDVFVARSTNAGDSWGTPTRLDTGTAPGAYASGDLAFDASGSIAVAAWADARSGFLDVYANFSIDGGVNWQPSDVRLDSSPLGTSDSENPDVYVSSTAAHVVWEDHRLGAGCTRPIGMECPDADLFYRRLQ
ncbi:MAG: MopE-related protein [Sandaracinaceae bacterium]